MHVWGCGSGRSCKLPAPRDGCGPGARQKKVAQRGSLKRMQEEHLILRVGGHPKHKK